MCKGMQGVLQKKEAEVTEKVTEMVFSVLNGVIAGKTDEELREKYGARQDQIDRARVALKDLLDRRSRP